jgi:hypothetical protein
MEKKICKKCGFEKEICEFYIQKRNKDGYWLTCKECERKKYHQNSEYVKKRVKNYRDNNKEKIKKNKKEYSQNNIEKERIRRRKYWDKYKEVSRKNAKERYQIDEIFKIKNNIRTRIRIFLKTKNILKTETIFNIVGCSPEFLKEHLEKQFKDGMSWENYGYEGWHIDHIIPLSSAKNKDEIYKLCHYSNLQPLWAVENLKKGNRIIK